MEKIIQTCSEMIIQRGYIVSTDINKEYNDRIIYDKDNHKICVFTTVISKFGVDRVTEYISAINEMKIDHCIVIYSNGVTPAANKVLSETTDIRIELFNDKELRYNITKHRLVPQHIKLSDDEAIDFKNKYGINFGTLFTSEAIARFYDYKPGNIIKIIRMNDSIGYRVVKYKILKKPMK